MKLFDSQLLIHYLTRARSFLWGMSGIIFLKFLPSLFPPPPVYSYFTLDHTQLISLHLCVFKRSYSCHHRGLVLGRSHSEVAQKLVHEWEKRRQRSAYAAASNKGSALSLGKHSSWRHSLHFSLAPIGVCWAELLFMWPQWLTSGVHFATVSVAGNSCWIFAIKSAMFLGRFTVCFSTLASLHLK